MAIVKFPSSIPTPQQLELPRAQLSSILHDLATEVMSGQLELMKSSNAPEFAAAVRHTAKKLAEASAGWAAFSDTIRDSWRI